MQKCPVLVPGTQRAPRAVGLELDKPRRERPLQVKGLCVSGFPPLAPLCPQSLFRAEVHTWQWNWGQGHVYKAGPVLREGGGILSSKPG